MQYLPRKRRILHIVHIGERSITHLFLRVYLDNNMRLLYNFQHGQLQNEIGTVKNGSKTARKLHF